MKKEVSTSLFHGMVELTRAWKMYSSVHKRLFNSYKNMEPQAEKYYGIDPNKLPHYELSDDFDNETNAKLHDNFEYQTNRGEEILSLDTIKELLAAVSFGYGLMQLCFSFLPQRLMSLVKLFGKLNQNLYSYVKNNKYLSFF